MYICYRFFLLCPCYCMIAMYKFRLICTQVLDAGVNRPWQAIQTCSKSQEIVLKGEWSYPTSPLFASDGPCSIRLWDARIDKSHVGLGPNRENGPVLVDVHAHILSCVGQSRIQCLAYKCLVYTTILVAYKRLYIRVCLSVRSIVRPSVCPSVSRYFSINAPA